MSVPGKTASGLCEYAAAMLGKPYWYGTYGQTANASLYGSKKKQFPAYYVDSDFKDQYGQRVHDCSGLIKGYLMSLGPEFPPAYTIEFDKSADGFYEVAEEKGPINTIPELPGVLVHMKDHIGIYVGKGEVIEARGHRYGVVRTKLKDRPWVRWSKCPYLSYASTPETPVKGDRYNWLYELPEWARPTIVKLIKAGALKGDGNGFDLSQDMVRLLVINDRMGVYD